MIRYEEVKSNEIKVRVGKPGSEATSGKRVGTIRKVAGGWSYFARCDVIGTTPVPTVDECKKVAEMVIVG